MPDRGRLRRRLVAFVAFAGFASTADALRIREMPFGDDESAKVVVVAPDDPGTYPLVLRLAPQRASDAVAAEFVARGFVFCDVRVATIGDDTAAQAMAWLARNSAGLGGDAARLHWLAESTAVPEAIEWLAQRASQPRLRGVVLLDPPGDAKSVADEPPPAMIGFRADAASSARAAEAHAARWREAGGAVEVEAMADPRDAMASITAWLASLDVRRVARVEALQFSPASDAAIDALARAKSLGALAHRDRVTGVVARFRATNARTVSVAVDDAPERTEAVVESPGRVESLVEADGVLYAWVSRRDAGLHRRIDGASPRWTRVRAFDDGGVPKLAAVSDPAGSGAESILLAFDGGRIERYDRVADRIEPEIELAAALRSFGHSGDVRFTAPIVALDHPVSGDRVQVLGVSGGADAGWFFVRHDGRYRYGRLRDFESGASIAKPLALTPSPLAAERGRVVYASGTGANGARVTLRAELPGSNDVREGFWWDRTRPGEGFSLHPAGEQWMLTWYAFDDAGQPTWRLAVGEITDGRFVPDSNGLASYRAPVDGKGMPTRDATPATASIDFAGGAGRDACRDGADRSDAIALAAVSIEIDEAGAERCIEPIAYGPAGRPSIDPTGFWSIAGDRSFSVLLAAQGSDGTTREAAMVLYYDRTGAPRWALGTGPAWRGATSLELLRFTKACRSCDPLAGRADAIGTLTHRLRGDCGALSGHLSISIAHETGALDRREAPVERLSDALCY